MGVGENGEFRVEGEEENDDDDLLEKEMEAIKKRKRAEDESSVDSLMGESPMKYQLDGVNDDEIIDKITKKKSPKKRKELQVSKKLLSPGQASSKQNLSESKKPPLSNSKQQQRSA